MRDTLERNFETAMGTLVRRRMENTYVDKRRNILFAWIDAHKRTKNACNVIAAITRQHLRQEVFQRIRMVARERHIDRVAIKACQRFFKLVKENNIKKAFSRWRENTLQLVVKQLE